MVTKTPIRTPAKTPTKTAAKDPSIALSLLSRAHSPNSAERIFDEKIRRRPLHLKPTESSSNADNEQQRRRAERLRKVSLRKKKLKPAPLSARQKRSSCLYDIPREGQKYHIYEPLHRMWIGYIQEVLGEGTGPVGIVGAGKLAAADFHGALLEVVRSRCVGRVGIKGIVVRDSRFVFEIVTTRDQLKVVPKEHTVFRFTVPAPGKKVGDRDGAAVNVGRDEEGGRENAEVPSPKELVFELHGSQFECRAADRANRKFKTHFLPDI